MRSSKIFKGILLVICTCLAGVSMMVSPSSASAKTAPAKVVSYSKISSSKRYHALYGNIYGNAKLTKKVHNASNFPNTVFSVTKSATIKKYHGSKSIYYYISNKSGTVKGWIWRGNLSPVKTYAQEKSDINAMIKIINTIDPDERGTYLVEMNDVTPQQAYSGISSVTGDIGSDGYYMGSVGYSENISEMQAMGKIYNLFEKRFTSSQKRTLNALYENYLTELDSAVSNKNNENPISDGSAFDDSEETDADAQEATSDLSTVLVKDIASLQKTV